MKTKVLVHGYNPKEPNWERVIWGEPPDKPGRVPMAVAAAIESNGELIIFHATDGSGPMMIKYWEDHCNQFGEFTCFDILKRISVDDIIATLNIQIVDLPVRPKNTWEEALALKKILKGNPYKIIAVSSMDHVPRVYRDFCRAFIDQPNILAHLSVRGALSLYGPKTSEEEEKWGMGHIVILEIPGVRANLELIRSKNWTPEPLP